VEAVVGNTVKLVEVELLEPARMTELPGRRVTPKRGMWTELHEAAKCGDVRAILRFAGRPELINGRDAEGWTPLAVAACHGMTEAVRALVSLGADVNMLYRIARTQRVVATRRGHVVVTALSSLDTNMLMEEDLVTALHIAALQGHFEVVEALALLGADVNVQLSAGATPVHIAAQEGHWEVVKTLVSLGADKNARKLRGVTPAYIAAQNGHLKVVEALAALGANLNLALDRGSTPIFVAALQGHVDVVRALASLGANVHTPLDDGTTPLMMASDQGHADVVTELLNAGASRTAMRPDGRTALWFAEASGRSSVVTVLGKT
jgi:ankyrin repeat protein